MNPFVCEIVFEFGTNINRLAMSNWGFSLLSGECNGMLESKSLIWMCVWRDIVIHIINSAVIPPIRSDSCFHDTLRSSFGLFKSPSSLNLSKVEEERKIDCPVIHWISLISSLPTGTYRALVAGSTIICNFSEVRLSQPRRSEAMSMSHRRDSSRAGGHG